MSTSLACPWCGAVNQPSTAHCGACGRSLADPLPATESGAGVGRLLRQRYRLLRLIGAGGFGVVYQAADGALGYRSVAIKEVSSRGLTPEEAQAATDAFHREALLLARLAHPHLPHIYEQFEEEGRWYLVMDFIAGETLETYLAERGGSLPVKEALQLALQLTDVLGYLHTRQPSIIFRDLKPSNIMRTPEGQLFLLDFGIARLFKPGQTKDTMAFGSPGYAAPEHYGTTQTTPRSDIFSLGALLHQLLTGRDPAETPFRFAPLTMPRPTGLTSLIGQMLELDEARRPPTMQRVQWELERLLDPQTAWRDDALAETGAPPVAAQTQAAPGALSAGYHWGAFPPGPGGTFRRSPSKNWIRTGLVITLVLAAAIILLLPLIFGLSSLLHPSVEGPPSDLGGNVPGGSAVIPVYALAWSPDGTRLASGGADERIHLWDLGSNPQTVTLETGSSATNELAWSPDGRYLASLDGGVIDLWNGSTGQHVSTVQMAVGINAFAWAPDSQQIALAEGNGTIRLLDIASGASDAGFSTRPDVSLNTVAWSPDGKYLAASGEEVVDPYTSTHLVFVWERTTGQAVYTAQDYDLSALSAPLAWSPDGTRIASSGGAGGTVQVWDALTGEHPVIYPFPTSDVESVAWSPDGKYLAFGDQQGLVGVWALGATVSGNAYTYSKHTGAIRAVVWSPNSQRIASASTDGTVEIWDALTGANVVTYQQP